MRKLATAAMLFATVGFLAGALRAQAPNTLTKEEAAAGWKLLFDGATLKGWEPHQAATWGVAEGAIFCAADSPGWLGSVDTFADFHLKLEFRGPAQINSGLFIRSQKQGAPATTGYEVQIWDFHAKFKTGALVNSLEAAPTKVLPDQWNSLEVTADGDHFVVVLNGQKLLDARDSRRLAAGVVGFQYNINTGKIEFRNVKIRPIQH